MPFSAVTLLAPRRRYDFFFAAEGVEIDFLHPETIFRGFLSFFTSFCDFFAIFREFSLFFSCFFRVFFSLAL